MGLISSYVIADTCSNCKHSTFDDGNVLVCRLNGDVPVGENGHCGSYFVASEYQRIYDEVESLFGERCPDWETDCANCRAWFAADAFVAELKAIAGGE